MSTVLFSPLGKTDPISGQHDGALLHIIRTYKPDIVYIYASKEICDFEDQDGRYSYCIEKLKSYADINLEVNWIRRENLTEVHIFDFFLTEFRGILTKLCDEYDDVLVNVSSGTPAMKSALQTLSAFFDKPIRPIQVATHARGFNEREDVNGDYSVEIQWECNIDNNEDYINRCNESPIVNLNAEIKRGIVIRHIQVYDYVAALTVANTGRDCINEAARLLIEAGAARLKLDKAECEKKAKAASYDIFPVRQGDKWQIFEYLMLLYIKIKKQEYADFLRGISPVFFDLMEKIILYSGKIDLKSITIQQKKTNNTCIKMWDVDRASRDPMVIAAGVNLGINKTKVIYTEDYVRLVEKINPGKRIIDLVNEIRLVEREIRNTAAHSITHITDEDIMRTTGYNAISIFKKLRILAQAIGVPFGDEELSTYDKLNDKIISLLI